MSSNQLALPYLQLNESLAAARLRFGSSQPSSPLECLPTEILPAITSYLDRTARINLRRTSKYFYQAVPAIEGIEDLRQIPTRRDLEAKLIDYFLGGPRTPSKSEIPKTLHRFWTGGPLRQEAMENLVNTCNDDWKGWTQILWYSKTIEDLMELGLEKGQKEQREIQRAVLVKLGYHVIPIEPSAELLGFEKQIKHAAGEAFDHYEQAVQNRWDGIKFFSDLSRLIYIYLYGGFHMDVDIGVGALDPNVSYYHYDPDIPLMGTVARDEKSEIAKYLEIIRKRRDQVTEGEDLLHYLEAAKLVVKEATIASTTYNALIASKEGNARVMNAISAYLDKIQSDGLDSGMAVNLVLLGGGTESGEPREESMIATVPPYLLALEHITQESSLGAV